MNTGPMSVAQVHIQAASGCLTSWLNSSSLDKFGAFNMFKVFQSKGGQKHQKLWYSLWCLWHPSRSSRSRRSEGHRVRSCLNWSYWRSGLNNLCCSKTKASLISTKPNPPVCEHLQHCCNISNAGILFCSNIASTPKSLAKQSCAKSPQRCPCALPAWRCARQSVAISPQAYPVATECNFFTIEWSQHNPKKCKIIFPL